MRLSDGNQLGRFGLQGPGFLEVETVARCDTLGQSQDVCKGSRFILEGKRCVASSWSLFKRLEVDEEEKRFRAWSNVDRDCRLLIVPPFRGSSRFESFI